MRRNLGSWLQAQPDPGSACPCARASQDGAGIPPDHSDWGQAVGHLCLKPSPVDLDAQWGMAVRVTRDALCWGPVGLLAVVTVAPCPAVSNRCQQPVGHSPGVQLLYFSIFFQILYCSITLNPIQGVSCCSHFGRTKHFL